MPNLANRSALTSEGSRGSCMVFSFVTAFRRPSRLLLLAFCHSSKVKATVGAKAGLGGVAVISPQNRTGSVVIKSPRAASSNVLCVQYLDRKRPLLWAQLITLWAEAMMAFRPVS